MNILGWLVLTALCLITLTATKDAVELKQENETLKYRVQELDYGFKLCKFMIKGGE